MMQMRDRHILHVSRQPENTGMPDVAAGYVFFIS